ncbi:MAG: hypothetical protein AB6733_00880 [Clostridiaceae bacterium]
MKKNLKKSILAILIIVISIMLVRKFLTLHQEFKNIKPPTKENRQLGNMSSNKILTVKKLSTKFEISEEEIFKAIEIEPQEGDEDMHIMELAKKYNKTPEEINEKLKEILPNPNHMEGKKNE